MTAVDLSCQELVELVTDYLDGALPGRERRRFERHLETCEWCVNYVDQIPPFDITVTMVNENGKTIKVKVCTRCLAAGKIKRAPRGVAAV